MEYLARNGYHVISMEQLVGFLEGKEAMPKKTVVITIDDGYRATYQVAFPVLSNTASRPPSTSTAISSAHPTRSPGSRCRRW